MGSLFSKPKESTVVVQQPGKSEEELELMRMQIDALRRAQEQTPEQKALSEKGAAYYEQMMAQNVLSPEEEAEFDKEYQLQLEALNEQYNKEAKEYGGTQMANLVARGMWDTSTGTQEISNTQEKFGGILASETSNMLQAKEYAKYDMEMAKRQLASSGYALTQGMSQSNAQTALQASMAMQNYYLNQGSMQANAALQNAMAQTARDQAQYKQRMALWSGVTGLGAGMMKAGFAGG